MATVTKQGKGYKITVSQGVDCNGKKIRKYMTWVPDPGMTERQIEKEVKLRAVLFEEQVKSGTAVNANIRFKDFSEKFMNEYAKFYLKPKTAAGYADNLKRINMAMGHIKLSELRAAHINSFYQNLQEEGVRNRVSAVCNFDLLEKIGTKHGALSEFARGAGVSRATVCQVRDGKVVSKESADAVAAALGMTTAKAFTITEHKELLAPTSVISYHHTWSGSIFVESENSPKKW